MTATDVQTITFGQASNMAMAEALELDESVLVFGEDVADEQGGGVIKVTSGLSTRFGSDRVRSTPISEQAIVGTAIGSAMAGMRPVAEIMLMNFIAVCMDQLFNHAAKLRFMSGGQTPLPLTIRTSTGGGLGFGAQHSDMLEAWIAHAPGLKIVMPSTPADAYGLLLSCIFDDDPCVFVENSMLYMTGQAGPAPVPGVRVPIGHADVLRSGADVSLIGYGRTIREALVVAEALAEEGIDAEVLDLRTVSPLDEAAILASVAKTKRAVVVHEAVRRFGVGAEIAARIHEELFGELQAPVGRVGARACPVPFSTALEQAYLPSAADIDAAVRATLA